MQRGKKPQELQAVKTEEQDDEEKPPLLQPVDYYRVNHEPPPKKFRNDTRRRYYYDRPPGRLAGNQNQRDASPERVYAPVERYNEEMSIRFLFGNGLSLNTIGDLHLKAFFNYLNPERALPDCQNMISKTMKSVRPPIPFIRQFPPVNVTIEAVRKNDEVFLAISSHMFDQTDGRQNFIHFDKIIAADYNGLIISDRLRRIIDPKRTLQPGWLNIMSPNIKLVQQICEYTNSMVRNKFICAFNFITGIARETLQIREFQEPLQILRNFVSGIRTHREVYTKFKKMQIDAGTHLELPPVDVRNEWLSTLQFISACSLLNPTFSNIQERWCMPKYLDTQQENAMSSLLEFLLMLCHVASKICSADSQISQVLYSMSIVNNSIENCAVRAARVELRTIFAKYYKCISSGKVGIFYSMAALLDPRYGYSETIFSKNDWKNVEVKLAGEPIPKHQMHNQRKLKTVEEEIRILRKLLTDEDRPDFDHETPGGMTVTKWWMEMKEKLPQLYRKWTEFAIVPAISIDGKRFFSKGGKFAHLFSTLDESMHHRALILAQNSQEFVGRGSECIAIFQRLKDVESNFQRLDFEEELEEEEVEQKPSTFDLGAGEGEGSADPEIEIKQEVIFAEDVPSTSDSVPGPSHQLLEPKLELLEPEGIKLEEPDY